MPYNFPIIYRKCLRSHSAHLEQVRKTSTINNIPALSMCFGLSVSCLCCGVGAFLRTLLQCSSTSHSHLTLCILFTGMIIPRRMYLWRSIHGLCSLGSHVKPQRILLYVLPWSSFCVHAVQVSKSALTICFSSTLYSYAVNDSR